MITTEFIVPKQGIFETGSERTKRNNDQKEFLSNIRPLLCKELGDDWENYFHMHWSEAMFSIKAEKYFGKNMYSRKRGMTFIVSDKQIKILADYIQSKKELILKGESKIASIHKNEKLLAALIDKYTVFDQEAKYLASDLFGNLPDILLFKRLITLQEAGSGKVVYEIKANIMQNKPFDLPVIELKIDQRSGFLETKRQVDILYPYYEDFEGVLVQLISEIPSEWWINQ